MESSEHILELIEYTDPYCTWCWGSEPILKRIKETFGDQVMIGYRMGGLVEDMDTFHDTLNLIGGHDWYKQVADHWLDASSRHGMPVDERIFYDIKDKKFSTYPASIAFKAAQFQDEGLAKRFLRRMREGTAAERMDIQDIKIQVGLAEEVGLERERFLDDINQGRAEEAFLEGLKEARSRGISGFPTFLVRNRAGEEVLSFGYRNFDEFEETFERLSGSELKPKKVEVTRDAVLDFVNRYQKVAPAEVSEVFQIGLERAMEWLDDLARENLIQKMPAGNGFFFKIRTPRAT